MAHFSAYFNERFLSQRGLIASKQNLLNYSSFTIAFGNAAFDRV